MFVGFSRRDRVLGVIVRIAANGYDMELRIGEHGIEISVASDRAMMEGAEFGGIQFARRTYSGNLRLGRGVDGGNVRSTNPAVTDNADVIFLHGDVVFVVVILIGTSTDWQRGTAGTESIPTKRFAGIPVSNLFLLSI